MYEIIQKKDLEDIQSEGYLLKHKKSGARILLVKNNDENKVFNIGFRTPAPDGTGLPHILEHSVLCGSKNFPVKDPFVELAKGSMNTFLNAMTYPDKTVYPIASCNDKDFQNLMHVYMDAVLYPNIYQYEEIFRQEGWCYQLESEDEPLTFNGVVYNEMKGAFSSPEGVLDRVILNSLFPDTSYANESGGNPDVIPELTYQQFLDFHKKYYHPSNSYIYLYGDVDMEEKLQWLDEQYLSHFEKIQIDSEIRFQNPFDQVKMIKRKYSISSNEDEQDNTYFAYNRAIGTSLDIELCLAFQVLDYVLLSSPGASLKKALLDAGIGKDVMGSYDNGLYQPIFSVVVKKANEGQLDQFIKIIEDTLAALVAKGVDKKAIEAGINYHEFRYREADFGNYPKGLMYGLGMFDSWLYDDSMPFAYMKCIQTFQSLKEKIHSGYYEEMIRKHLLDNTHASIIVVSPEKGGTQRKERELAEKLRIYKESLSKQEVSKLVVDTKALLQYQEEPSTQENLAKIPLLTRADISRESAPIYNTEIRVDNTLLLHHNIETNGIGYLNFLFDLSGISAELLPYVGILQGVLGLVDTTNYEYGELFNEINVHTGGIKTTAEAYPDVTKVKEKEFKAVLKVKSKALYEKLPVAFDMVREILMESKLDDEKRLTELLAIFRSRLQSSMHSQGHVTASTRALSYSSPVAQFKELMGGIDFYNELIRIEKNFEAEKSRLIANLNKLREMIFRADNMMISYTSTQEGLDGIPQLIGELKGHLYQQEIKGLSCVIHCEKKNEGFKTSSQVQYVARAGNFIDGGVEYSGALQILRVILGYDYLWQNVRVKGGAYGCMSSFNRLGEGYFVSYRDPNLEKTIEVYERVADYLRSFSVEERDMTKFIIGTISSIDRPLTPAGKGERSLGVYMNNISEEMIRQEREQVLDATQQDIRKLAEVVDAVMKAGLVCVIGSEERVEQAREIFMTVRDLH